MFHLFIKYILEDYFFKVIFICFVISFIVLNIYIIFIDFIPQLFYYYIILIFGFLMVKYQQNLSSLIKKIKIKNMYLKPIMIGYFMVLFEEFFAAFFNHISEGFSFSLFIIRIFQFQFFNIFAFTSLILTLTYFLIKYKFSKKELFIYLWCFSIFSE